MSGIVCIFGRRRSEMKNPDFRIALLMLIISTALVYKVGTSKTSPTSTGTIVRFNPAHIQISSEQTFTIAVLVENVTDFYGFDIQITWNTTYVKYVNHTVTVPVETYPDGLLHQPVIRLSDKVNETDPIPDAEPGTKAWICYVSYYPAASFNGTGNAFTMTFRTLNRTGITTMNFTHIDLATKQAMPIPHTSFGCVVEISEDLTPPDIGAVEWKPTCPYPYVPSDTVRANEPVFITANVTEPPNASGVAKVELLYKTETSGWWETSMVYNETLELWTTTIPGQLGNTTVEFMIKAHDYNENEITSSPYTFNVKPLLIGDIDGDGDVDLYDAVALLLNYGQKSP